MNRSFSLAEPSVGSWQVSVGEGHSPQVCLRLSRLRSAHATRHTSPVTRHFVPRAAFTLIELLVVVSIVAILAGLVLSTLGYVNRKGAASRAQSEVAALSAAIESYKLDVGSYPADSDLYGELTGGGPVNTGKVYFEPTTGMINTNSKTRSFQDPYGNPYNYTTNATRNIGFFDLWCVPPTANSEADWIHN